MASSSVRSAACAHRLCHARTPRGLPSARAGRKRGTQTGDAVSVPSPQEGQSVAWVRPSDLDSLPVCPADKELLPFVFA